MDKECVLFYKIILSAVLFKGNEFLCLRFEGTVVYKQVY